ncbi:MAG: SAM-dependent chlorinase/fluorinase [Deltaproteobacteria bacterium]|nr:SAM-dependent chlorinase/fluorinase [Deltaproteobacteria bacterium]
MIPTVALITDFGTTESYVAELHAAMLARVPALRILDVTHQVAPFDLVHASLVLERVVATLAHPAVVVVVVDPGVGTARRGVVVARENGVLLVGPDNGVLAPIDGEAICAWEISSAFRQRNHTATTFDGRDLFGPLGAMLAAGLHPTLVGPTTDLSVPSVVATTAEWREEGELAYASGRVVMLDRYGNAVTNIRARTGQLTVLEPLTFRGPCVRAYGAVLPGESLALVGSSGRLELAVREASSGLSVGTKVTVRCDR